MVLNRTLFSVEVVETDKGRDYWATRPWTSTIADRIRTADVLVVPWENFRENQPVLFPTTTTELFRDLSSKLSDAVIAVASDEASYKEIALHGAEIRLPTLLATAIILPVALNVLSTRIDHLIFDKTESATVEMEVIVEGERGRCISIKYKGPPNDMVESVTRHAEKCLPPKQTDDRNNKGKSSANPGRSESGGPGNKNKK